MRPPRLLLFQSGRTITRQDIILLVNGMAAWYNWGMKNRLTKAGAAREKERAEGFCVQKKTFFKDFELDAMAEIIAKNMVILGVNATSNELKMWKENMQALAKRDDYFLYLIYQDGAICGFAELCEGKDGLLYLAEIQLAENVKGTRVLLKTLQFLAAEKDFERYDAVYFNINNNNDKSKNTFMHLGGVVIEKREKTSLYRLDKQVMLNTLSHFRR